MPKTIAFFLMLCACVGLLLIIVVAAGCTQAPNTMAGEERYRGGLETHINIANPRLQKRIALISADSRSVNDLLDVAVELENRTKKTLRFEHLFKWYDMDGFEVRDPTSHWSPGMIAGREGLLLQDKAPNPECFTFILFLRPPVGIE
jgi:uncharacterized protein YcfL